MLLRREGLMFLGCFALQVDAGETWGKIVYASGWWPTWSGLDIQRGGENNEGGTKNQ